GNARTTRVYDSASRRLPSRPPRLEGALVHRSPRVSRTEPHIPEDLASREDEIRAALDPSRIPRHIAIIMDGNGRWAELRGLPRVEGHRAGREALRRAVEGARESGVKVLTLYTFSTENWRRPREEVQALMTLLVETAAQQAQVL